MAATLSVTLPQCTDDLPFPSCTEDAPPLESRDRGVFKHLSRHAKWAQKMGLVPAKEITHVSFHKKGYLTVQVKHPEVFRLPKKNFFVTFGEPQYDYSHSNEQDSAARCVTNAEPKHVTKEWADDRAIRATRHFSGKSPLLEPDRTPETSFERTPQSCGISLQSEASLPPMQEISMRALSSLESVPQKAPQSQVRKDHQGAKKTSGINEKNNHGDSEKKSKEAKKTKSLSKKSKKIKGKSAHELKGSSHEGKKVKKSQGNGKDHKIAGTTKSHNKPSPPKELDTTTVPHEKNQSQGNANINQKKTLGAVESNHKSQHGEKQVPNNLLGGQVEAHKEHKDTRSMKAESCERGMVHSNKAEQHVYDADVCEEVLVRPTVRGELQNNRQENRKQGQSSFGDTKIPQSSKKSKKIVQSKKLSSSRNTKNGKKKLHDADASDEDDWEEVHHEGGTMVFLNEECSQGRKSFQVMRPCFDDGQGEEEKCEFSDLAVSVVMSCGGATRGTAIRALKRNKGNLLHSVFELTLDVTI